MSGEIEAAGDAVTGGLLARAVERQADARTHEHGICRNCATALEGDYCHACGQPAHIHRSLAALWHDLAHGVLHFEGKIFRTLPMLAWRPGELTRRYIAGERARFVSPLALFLFTVFLMFATFSAFGGGLTVPDNARAALVEEAQDARSDFERLGRERAAARAAGRDTRALDSKIAEARGELAERERIAIGFGDERSIIQGSTGWTRLDKGIAKAAKNPNLLIYKLQANAYKFSWALIPLSVPFVWLLFFWRRDLHVYDHAVFVTYSLGFMSLLAIVLTLLGQVAALEPVVALSATIVPPVHLFRQLRQAYRLTRVSALIRLFILLVCSGVVLTLFLLLLVGLGLLG